MKSSKDAIVMATNNAHKLEEVRRMCGDSIKVLSLSDIDCYGDIPETGTTLATNALQKARWVKQNYGYDCFADDTGLMVDALDGEPGVFSARYAGPGHDAEANMKKLLKNMKDVENRNAHFSTVIAFLSGDKEILIEGRVDGVITKFPKGVDGFGYDPVFQPNGYGITFAEMSPDLKNSISHRGKAMQKLMGVLFDD